MQTLVCPTLGLVVRLLFINHYSSEYATSRDPTPLGVVRVRWPEHGNAGRHLVINDRPSRGSQEPFAKRFAFWTNVYKQFDQYVQNGGVREPQIPLK